MDVVRSVYEAFAAADADRIAGHLHPDVELTDPDLPGGGTFHGIAGVFEFLQLWSDGFRELHVDVEELIPDRRSGSSGRPSARHRGSKRSGRRHTRRPSVDCRGRADNAHPSLPEPRGGAGGGRELVGGGAQEHGRIERADVPGVHAYEHLGRQILAAARLDGR